MTEITTAAELDALANGSLIRDSWGALGERTEDGWDFSSWRGLATDRIALPATVLYRPDRPSDSALREGVAALSKVRLHDAWRDSQRDDTPHPGYSWDEARAVRFLAALGIEVSE